MGCSMNLKKNLPPKLKTKWIDKCYRLQKRK